MNILYVLTISWKGSLHLESSGKQVGEVRLLWCTINAYSWNSFNLVHAKTLNQFRNKLFQLMNHLQFRYVIILFIVYIHHRLFAVLISICSVYGYVTTHLHVDYAYIYMLTFSKFACLDDSILFTVWLKF
jgi:hypothetical protein